MFPIRVPVLRERREDIPVLLEYFLDCTSREYGRRFELTAAVELLQGYEWPGNVREMENLVERLSIVTEGNMIDLRDLPSFLHGESPIHDMEDDGSLSRLEEMEKKEVVAALYIANTSFPACLPKGMFLSRRLHPPMGCFGSGADGFYLAGKFVSIFYTFEIKCPGLALRPGPVDNCKN